MISIACQIAREAGRLIHDHFGRSQEIKHSEAHDVKLQMDVSCQRLIESRLRRAFPDHAIVGEEGDLGEPDAECRWIVDPIDGTVNYSYGIPHFCVSLALQHRSSEGDLARAMGGYAVRVGVIYDPLRDEIFTAEEGKGAFLNGEQIHVSQRSHFHEAILSVGFSKTKETIERGLHDFQILVHQARKLRMMGSAALDLAYVAAGRMEAYIESRVRLWDIAAGVLLVKEAGGHVRLRPIDGMPHAFETVASNAKLNITSLLHK